MNLKKKLPLFLLLSGSFSLGLCFSSNTEGVSALNVGENPVYVSGGIGDDDPVISTKQDYNLHMVFAAKGSGEYLADVKVLIHDSSGTKVLEAESPGPLFYAKMRPGKYQVTASFSGQTVKKSANIKANGNVDLYFYWNE